MLEAPRYTLRQATHGDFTFLYALHVASMKDSVARTWGWDDAFQERLFAERFDPSHERIVVVDGQDVGVVAVEWRDADVFLAKIEILPAYQGRGLGSAIIRTLIAAAYERGLPVTLRVLKVNAPARRLYERLGFIVTGETEMHYLMRTAD